MLKLLSVFIGGGIGSCLRFLVSILSKNTFYGTFFVNIIGSFILGFLFYYLTQKYQIQKELKLLLTVGFCGGFTTFSTFSLENFNLIQQGEYLKSLTYIVSSIIISIFMVFIGVYIAKQF